MKSINKIILILTILLFGIVRMGAAQNLVPNSAISITWSGVDSVTVTSTAADTSDAFAWGFSYYHSLQYYIAGSSPNVKIEIYTAMADDADMYQLAYTVTSAGTVTGWHVAESIPVAGTYYMKVVVTGNSGNGTARVKIKQYIINLVR